MIKNATPLPFQGASTVSSISAASTSSSSLHQRINIPGTSGSSDDDKTTMDDVKNKKKANSNNGGNTNSNKQTMSGDSARTLHGWLGIVIVGLLVVIVALLSVMAYACWQVSVSVNSVTSNVSGPVVQETMLHARDMSANPVGYVLENYQPAQLAANDIFLLLNAVAKSNVTDRAVQLLQTFIADEEAFRAIFKRMIG